MIDKELKILEIRKNNFSGGYEIIVL